MTKMSSTTQDGKMHAPYLIQHLFDVSQHLLDVSHFSIGLFLFSMSSIVVSELSESPSVTIGAIILAGIGLASLWVRARTELKKAQIDFDIRKIDYEKLKEEVLELRVWKEAAGCIHAFDCPNFKGPGVVSPINIERKHD